MPSEAAAALAQTSLAQLALAHCHLRAWSRRAEKTGKTKEAARSSWALQCARAAAGQRCEQVAATTALAKAGRVRPKGHGQRKMLQVHGDVKRTSNRAVNLQLAIPRRTFSSWTASSMQSTRRWKASHRTRAPCQLERRQWLCTRKLLCTPGSRQETGTKACTESANGPARSQKPTEGVLGVGRDQELKSASRMHAKPRGK